MRPNTVTEQFIPRAADLVALLAATYETAHPTDWEMRFHNFLDNCLGDTDPADLSPNKLIRFWEQVFFDVKQKGVHDPAGWIAGHRAQFEGVKERKHDDGIDWSLTFDGLLFLTSIDWDSYRHTLVEDRQQWLGKHPGRWRHIEDVPRKTFSRPPAKSQDDRDAERTGPSDPAPPGTQRHDDGLAMGGTLARDRAPPIEITETPPLAPAMGENGTTKSTPVPVDPAMSEATPPVDKIKPATTSAASPPHPPLRKAAFGTTKAKVLSYAKARLEAGASPREIAEILACAHEDFDASSRESGRAVGHDHTWVSRLLRWRRDGYKAPGHFGATTRAARAALRKNKKSDSGGSAEQLDDDGYIGSPAHKPPTLSASVNGNFPSGSTRTALLPKAAAATSETNEPNTQPDQLDNPDYKPDPSVVCQQPEKQQLPGKKTRVRPKLSPERMLIVIEALRECPILSSAAAKAGIHPKTLSYWLQCSKAGDDGYDIVWQDEQDRFHELCNDAIADAMDEVRDVGWKIALGVKFKINKVFLKFGGPAIRAYTEDENGNRIEVPLGRPNSKMLRFMMEWEWPEKYGKHPKGDIPRIDGVLVIGERTKKRKRPKSNCASRVRARRWKSLSRKVRAAQA